MDIAHEEKNGRGRFSIPLDSGAAELTYRLGGEVMTIDHTYVPPPARGGDLAMRLVRRAVEEARARKLKIDPQCPYVARVFDFMPEWSRLRA